MNCEVVKWNDRKFSVLEKRTECILSDFTNQKDAKNYARFLNMGGGFDGWTPFFILQKINVDELENTRDSYK